MAEFLEIIHQVHWHQNISDLLGAVDPIYLEIYRECVTTGFPRTDLVKEKRDYEGNERT